MPLILSDNKIQEQQAAGEIPSTAVTNDRKMTFYKHRHKQDTHRKTLFYHFTLFRFTEAAFSQTVGKTSTSKNITTHFI